MKYIVLFVLFGILPSAVQAKHKPKPPTQPDVVYECIAVRNIRSTTEGLTSNAGVWGTVENNCDQAAQIFVTTAMYDSSGTQYNSDIQILNLQPHTSEPFHGGPARYDPRLRSYAYGRVVEVKAFAR